MKIERHNLTVFGRVVSIGKTSHTTQNFMSVYKRSITLKNEYGVESPIVLWNRETKLPIELNDEFAIYDGEFSEGVFSTGRGGFIILNGRRFQKGLKR